MDRIARIQEMETHLDRVNAVLRNTDAASPELLAVQDSVRSLSAYYSSPLWREDFQADEAGSLPRDLRRGVLSEDAIYDLLAEYDERLNTMERTINMNSPLDTLLSRRSIRKFKPERPERSDLEQIIEAGLYAANGMGKQAPIVVAVTNKDLRDRLSEMNRRIGGWPEGFDPFYGAPVVLIVLADKTVPTYVYDGSLMMGNLMQAAHLLGLGSIWIHRAKQEFESEEGKAILKALGVEGDYEGIGHCALGYIDGAEPEARPRNDGRVFWAE